MKDYEELAKRLLSDAQKWVPDAIRAAALTSIAEYIAAKIRENKPAKLNFICTHNSRRSHFGQVMAQVLAAYLKIENMETYSGGTEATAFHTNAVKALQELGVSIEKLSDTDNPHYRVGTGSMTTEAFSKIFSEQANPQKDFVAIMVCSSADAGCPFVAGAEARISLPFDDPKTADGTTEQATVYRERALQIGTELAWAFTQITLKKGGADVLV